MSRLDRIKVIAKDDVKTVYQLNRKLLMKVVQHDGYCKVYLKVLDSYPEWSIQSQYKFVAITSSDKISNIFNEVDQLGIMSLQVFAGAQKGNDTLRSGMSFDSIFLNAWEIDAHIGVLKLFDKQNDLDDLIFGGSPYLKVWQVDGGACVELNLYRPLSLYELVE